MMGLNDLQCKSGNMLQVVEEFMQWQHFVNMANGQLHST